MKKTKTNLIGSDKIKDKGFFISHMKNCFNAPLDTFKSLSTYHRTLRCLLLREKLSEENWIRIGKNSAEIRSEINGQSGETMDLCS